MGQTPSKSSFSAGDTYDALAPVYDDFTHELDYEKNWLAEVLPRLERYGLSGRRLLDVGCGTAESLIPMLKRGWQVMGCDISAKMVEIARQKVGDDVRLEVADMRSLPRFGAFDLVWSLNDSINYLIEPGDLGAALQSLRANLDDAGLLVFDVNTLMTYRTFFAEEIVVERGGRRLVWVGRASKDQPPGSICEAEFRAEGSAEQIAPHIHRQRHYPEAEALAALEGAGLECLDIFGQDGEGRLSQPLDEAKHAKGLYFAQSASG